MRKKNRTDETNSAGLFQDQLRVGTAMSNLSESCKSSTGRLNGRLFITPVAVAVWQLVWPAPYLNFCHYPTRAADGSIVGRKEFAQVTAVLSQAVLIRQTVIDTHRDLVLGCFATSGL